MISLPTADQLKVEISELESRLGKYRQILKVVESFDRAPSIRKATDVIGHKKNLKVKNISPAVKARSNRERALAFLAQAKEPKTANQVSDALQHKNKTMISNLLHESVLRGELQRERRPANEAEREQGVYVPVWVYQMPTSIQLQ